MLLAKNLHKSCKFLARKGTYSVHRTCKHLQDFYLASEKDIVNKNALFNIIPFRSGSIQQESLLEIRVKGRLPWMLEFSQWVARNIV